MQIPGHIDPVTTGTVPLRGGNRIDLVGLTRDAIGGVLVEAGLDAKAAKLRAKQIWHWIYHRGVTDFEAMTDIAKTMRPWLTDRFIIGRPTVREAQVSSDGTRKWLLAAADGQEYEMVFIPDADRGTLVRVEPGRLHAQLPLLPHRHDAAGPQPRRGRDRRAGDAGARRAGRMAQGHDGRLWSRSRG